MRWRLGSLLAVTLAACVVVGVAIAGSSPRGTAATPCTESNYPGFQVTFGHTATQAEANALQKEALAAGFQGTKVLPGCTSYEIGIPGVCPASTARAVQNEAHRAGFNAILEYMHPYDRTGDLEVVFAHFHDLASAQALQARARTANFRVSIEQDGGCNSDWEVEQSGLSTEAQAQNFVGEATAAGFGSLIIEAS